MPWTPEQASRYVQGLTAHQRLVWSRVANSARKSCLASGRDAKECDARAIRQANAVAQRVPTKSIKALGDGGALEILAIPYGGPFGGRDGDGEFFSSKTDLCLSWFPDRRPLLYHHGLDAELAVTPIGTVDTKSARQDAAGWWVRAQLDRSGRYWKHITDLLAAMDDPEQEGAGGLYASSGAYPHLVRKSQDGEILRWPWVELSLTPEPANLFALVHPASAKAHYKAAGLVLPEVPEGPEAPAVEQPGTPSDEPDALDLLQTVGLNYGAALEGLLAEIPDFLARTKVLAALRLKAGRAISAARRARLVALVAHFRTGATDLEALLEETAPPERDERDDDEEPEAAGADAPAADQPPAKAAGAQAGAARPPLDRDARTLDELRARLASWRPHYAAVANGPAAPTGE